MCIRDRISEATPGYFGDRGKVGTVQPNHGLDAVFGVREDEVEFMPDIGDRIHLEWNGKPVAGGGFLQAYAPTTGTARGAFADGRTAVIEHSFGAGRTLLVGTHPGIAYFRTSNPDNLAYFADGLAWAGKKPRVSLSNPKLQARLHEGPEGAVLWVLNPTRESQKAEISVDQQIASFGEPYWSTYPDAMGAGTITVPPRDVLILRLNKAA
jgi:beta-galactosidase